MAQDSGPTLLIGQGEQYWDPEDWRELVRARRLRRGMDVAVREHGLTAYRPVEDVPGLSAILDELDPLPERAGGAASPRPQEFAGSHTGPSAVAVETRPPTSVTAVPVTATDRPDRATSTISDTSALGGKAARTKRRSPALVVASVVGGLMIVSGLANMVGKKTPSTSTAPEASTTGPSFTCTLAKARSATVICGDPALEAADRRMADLYRRRVILLGGEEKVAMRAQQRAWLARREGCMRSRKAHACISRAYQARIKALSVP